MKSLPLRSCAAALLASSVLVFSACQGDAKAAPKPAAGGSHATVRVPNGAASKHEAAVKFFNAYKTHNKAAAQEVASDAAVRELRFDPASGTNTTLQLMDDAHIYYEGGSIELTFARNAAGRWYVRSLTSTAD